VCETEARIIDLDQPAVHQSPPGGELTTRWRRVTAVKIPAVAAASLMIVAGVAGGIGVSTWSAHRVRQAPRPAFSVLVFPESTPNTVDIDNGASVLTRD
jgi:hypothetical protein